MTRYFRPCATAAAVALALGCTDAGTPLAIEPESAEPAFGASVVATFECTGNPASGDVECRQPLPSAGEARPAILAGGEVKLRSSNVTYDQPTQIFAFDVTLENLLGEPIGTPDSVTAVGSKVFYDTGPSIVAYNAPGDTGTINVANADGYATFTRAGQPYHFYPQILLPNDTSPPKRWKLRMPMTVKTFAFTLKVFTSRPSEPPVSASAPDTLPESLYAAGNVVTDLPGMSGTYLRDVVTVFFQPTATLQERQAAIDHVQGVVIGGVRIDGDDGMYYVRIAGGTTAQPLLDAIDRLESLPQVVGAAPDFILSGESLSYLAPKDSVGAWDQWRLDPNQADGLNWAQEAVAAPYAWGCETGSSAIKMAIVDHDLNLNASELQPNLGAIRFGAPAGSYSPLDRSSDHATHVLSVLAARGNNGHGMAGIMWNARVDFYETATDSRGRPTLNASGKAVLTNAQGRLAAAIASGARAINFSIARAPRDTTELKRWRSGGNDDDSTEVYRLKRSLTWAIRWNRIKGKRPLIVLAAGNFAHEEFFGGYASVVDTYPDQVLVVGSVTHKPGQGYQGGSWIRSSFSNFGGRVHIAAPGEGVSALDRNGQNKLVNGTSFAAPMVTGAAGLLLSFDPSLTTEEVRELLIQGAQSGGLKIDNSTYPAVPILNVHESLKRAARRIGAPLCGNRVWRDGAAVVAQRGTGSETIFTAPDYNGHIDNIQVLHGGKRIRFDQWTGSDVVFQWVNGDWEEDLTPATEAGPSHNSWQGYSHDRTRRVYVDRYPGSHVDLRIKNLVTGSDSLLRRYQLFRASTYADACVRRSTGDTIHAPACSQNTSVGSRYFDEHSYPAFSPRGDWVYLALYRSETSAATRGSWYLCPGQDVLNLPMNHMECLDTTSRQWYSGGVVYAVNPDDGTIFQTVLSEVGAFGEILAADGVPEVVIQKTTHDQTSYSQWLYEPNTFGMPHLQTTSTTGSPPACVSQYRSLPSWSVVSTRGCAVENMTFSPNVAAEAPASRSRGR